MCELIEIHPDGSITKAYSLNDSNHHCGGSDCPSRSSPVIGASAVVIGIINSSRNALGSSGETSSGSICYVSDQKALQE